MDLDIVVQITRPSGFTPADVLIELLLEALNKQHVFSDVGPMIHSESSAQIIVSLGGEDFRVEVSRVERDTPVLNSDREPLELLVDEV